MMKLLSDADGKGFTVSLGRVWREEQVAAGFTLYSFGTEPDGAVPEPAFRQRAVATVSRFLQTAFEQIAQSPERTNLRFAGAHLMDSLRKANTQIRQWSAALGQGIYLTGTVTYLAENQLLSIPFGDGAVFSVKGMQIQPQGEPLAADGLLRSALGAVADWKATAWVSQVKPDVRFLCLCVQPKDPAACAAHLRDDSVADVLMLRRELEAQTGYPGAVQVYIPYSETGGNAT